MKAVYLTPVWCTLLLVSACAFAWQVPGYRVDTRVREVFYDADEVVRIVTQRGVGTQIVLGAGEQIVTAALGDRADVAGCGRTNADRASNGDWKIAACKGDANIYLKPGTGAHDTNLIVHTTRRNYVFDLMVLPAHAKFGNDQVMYRVTFTYREADDAPGKAVLQSRLIAQREAVPAAPRNAAYSMQAVSHSEDIRPSAVWDDGRFTTIQIPGNRKMPAIFRLAEDGTEHVPDKHIEGDKIVVHEVAKQWVLRLGNEAVEIWNDAYDLDGVPPINGTTVPGVSRLVKEREHD